MTKIFMLAASFNQMTKEALSEIAGEPEVKYLVKTLPSKDQYVELIFSK